MAKLNYPSQQQPDVKPGQISTEVGFMTSLATGWKFTNDPVLVEQRVKWFFDQCAANDIRPTVALLAVALNTSRQTMWQWEQKGGRLGQTISQAKRILNALLENWSVTGRINPVSAVWLQKNHFGYRDTVTIEAKEGRDLQPSMTPDEIMERIAKDIPLDALDGDFVDADVKEGVL